MQYILQYRLLLLLLLLLLLITIIIMYENWIHKAIQLYFGSTNI